MVIKNIIAQKIINNFPDLTNLNINNSNKHEVILELINPEGLIELLNYLKTDPSIYCEQLMDLCAVDYLHYRVVELNGNMVSSHGFTRAVNDEHLSYMEQQFTMYKKCRFAIVYQLLSITNNLRIMLKCLLNNANKLSIPSCVEIWPAANWYEREVFDMFGIEFIGHPNLTRILTEDNFNGYPFRKDFPVMGKHEVRFDAKQKKVIQQAVDVESYPVVPKVIHNNNSHDENKEKV